MFDFTSILSPVLGRVLDKVFPDQNAINKSKLDLLTAELNAELQPMLKQLEINAAEAAHASPYVSGWRPFIGWVCGIAFATQFVVFPLLVFFASICGTHVPLPQLDFTTMSAVLFGMLGLGTLRTYEKAKGLTRVG